MSFRHLLLAELALLVVGLLWAFLGSLPVPIEWSGDAVGAAAWLTLGLVVVNFTLFDVAARVRAFRSVYAFLEEEVFPLVRTATPWDLLAAAALAGAAEELFFRGLLQPRIGLVAASALFGYLHGPSRSLLSLAVWAGVVGAALGLSFRVTDNLAVPVIAHGLYDAVALFYIRYGHHKREASMTQSPSEKSLTRIRKFVESYCSKSGTTTHPDSSVTESVVLGLASNLDELGRPLCPCRFYPDKREEIQHRTWICACDDMQIYKYCHCLLFVNEQGQPITEYLPEDHDGRRIYGLVKDPTPALGRALRDKAAEREKERKERPS